MADTASVFETDEETEQRAIDEARAAINGGLYVDHDQGMNWVKSWSAYEELPPPNPR